MSDNFSEIYNKMSKELDKQFPNLHFESYGSSFYAKTKYFGVIGIVHIADAWYCTRNGEVFASSGYSTSFGLQSVTDLRSRFDKICEEFRGPY